MKTKPKYAYPTMPLKQAVKHATKQRDELLANGCTADEMDVAALSRLIDFADTPDDRTRVNELLFYAGILCAMLGLCLGICGSVYVFLGKMVEAQTLQPYASGFAVAALLCFWGVRR